ncbi:unnamed protein product [Ixodes persulcatus]
MHVDFRSSLKRKDEHTPRTHPAERRRFQASLGVSDVDGLPRSVHHTWKPRLGGAEARKVVGGSLGILSQPQLPLRLFGFFFSFFPLLGGDLRRSSSAVVAGAAAARDGASTLAAADAAASLRPCRRISGGHAPGSLWPGGARGCGTQ